MLGGKPFTGAAKSAHHLVVDHQDAVFVAERAKFWIVIVRRNQQAVRTGDALDKNGRDGIRPFHLDDFFDVRNTFAMAGFYFLPERTTIAIGIEDANDSWQAGLDWPTPRITRGGHRTHSGTVIGTIASDDFVAAGRESGHLHGVFVGFRAAQREKCFRQAGNRGKFLSQLAAWLGGKAWSCKTQLVHLFLDGFQHFWMLMTNVQVDELRAEIQPAIVIAVPKPNALTSLHVNGIRCRLNRPREHRVLAVFLHHFKRMRVHRWRFLP